MQDNFTIKAMKSLGFTAVFLAPVTANAVIVHVSGSSIVIGVTVGGIWDVDGTGADEFEFRNIHQTFPGDRTFISDDIRLFSSGPLNGRGLVGPNPYHSGVAVLSQSEHVGAGQGSSRSPILGSSYGRSVMNAHLSRVVTFTTHNISARAPYYHFYAFGQDPGYLGFAFDPGDGVRYGWAKLQFEEDGLNSSLTIEEWAYEDTLGKAIHVGSVPAPPAAAAGLTLLAMGAASVRAQRRQKAASA
jgi:hypothetical protein